VRSGAGGEPVPGPEAPPRTLRLFFALWPPPEIARALHAWALGVQRRSGGRVVPAAAIHLTLAFLGEVPAGRLALALEAAGAVRFAAHEIPIETACAWPHRAIVWAGPRETPQPTAALVEHLRLALAARGFEIEKRPFAAHVTLVRRAHPRSALPPLAPLAWPVGEFALVRSRLSTRGADYEPLARFAAR